MRAERQHLRAGPIDLAVGVEHRAALQRRRDALAALRSAGCIVTTASTSAKSPARSMRTTSEEEIDEIVRKIIRSRLTDGQLDECDLNMRDVEKVRETFVKMLQERAAGRGVTLPGKVAADPKDLGQVLTDLHEKPGQLRDILVGGDAQPQEQAQRSNPIIDMLSSPQAKAVLAGIAAMVVKRVMQGSSRTA